MYNNVHIPGSIDVLFKSSQISERRGRLGKGKAAGGEAGAESDDIEDVGK